MADKGTNANKGQWFQRFVASSISGMSGEVSDATIQGYLRAASQLEDIWQQIDDNVNALIIGGMAPWDAYSKMAYALALIRACRINVVFVQELLKANAMVNPATASYLPRITYEQALALCQHIEPLIEEAIKASTNPASIPTSYKLPFAFGPRVRPADPHLPPAHVQGFIRGAQQARDWAAGLLAQYEIALNAPKKPIPQSVATHLEQMKSELGLGDFHLRSGTDMTGQIMFAGKGSESSGQPIPDELSAKAEDLLWEAVESFFKVSQLVAFPVTPVVSAQQPQPPSSGRRQAYPYQQRHIIPDQNAITPSYTPPPMPVPQTPPPPDVYDLLNQVTSTPTGQTVSVPPTPDISSLLDQVTANPEPEATAKIPPSTSPSPDLSDMFNQITASPADQEMTPKVSPSPSPSPDTSDLLNQVINGSETGQQIPAQTTRPSQGTRRKPPSGKAASQDNTLDLLAEISGEQQTQE